MNASTILNEITLARRSQAEANRYFLARDEKIGQKLRDCGSWLHMREWIESGESRLVNANFCKKFLLCKSCARRRAGKLILAYAPKVESVMQAGGPFIPAMVTLTIKNGENLAERMAHFKASWKSMIAKRRRGASSKCHDGLIEWNKVAGSLRSIEVTNKGNGWHVHAHVFVLLTEYIDQSKLSEEWHQITGDSFVVGVTMCRDGVVPGLVETVKYAVKFSDMEPGQLWDVFKVAQGNRFFDAQGALRGVSEPEIDQDDTEGLTGPFRDFLALWMWGREGYSITPYENDAPLPTRPAAK